MRIDSSQSSQGLAESQATNNAATTKAGTTPESGVSSPLGEDQAQLSGVHAQVQVLVGQALQLPEVRQERVQALRQAVTSGKYQPSAQDVAGALLLNTIAVKLAA
jgi:flagellar biosynthesis anti-sigma factor FlgM